MRNLNNYIFLIKSISLLSDGIRFQSIFLEPGYLGCLLAFLLYANKFHFRKWYVSIMLLSLILSLSLSGYVLFLAGYIISIIQNKRIASLFLMGFVVVPLVFIGGISYNSGKNVLNEKIIQRLVFDEEKGISGNNRSTSTTDDYYDNMLITGEIILGLGPNRVKAINGALDNQSYDNGIAGAGYKVYLVTNGLISAIVFLFFYFYLGRSTTNDKKYMLGFVFVIFCAFISQGYPENPSWYLSYLLGVGSSLNN